MAAGSPARSVLARQRQRRMTGGLDTPDAPVYVPSMPVQRLEEIE